MADSLKSRQYILVFGASLVDIFGFCSKKYNPCDSIPGNIKISFGGVSRNIAENMARVGINVKFISILGDDESGRALLESSKKVGYDMSHSMIVPERSTPTYMAILNDAGEMVSAVADMQLMSAMNKDYIDSKADLFKGAEYTFLDADDPINLEYILTKFAGQTNFILDPISVTKAESVKHLVKYFHTIKPNRVEAEAMVGFPIITDEDLKRAGRELISQGIKKVFISLDEEGIFYDDGVQSGKVKALGVEVKNVTGAGDSFVAGLGYSYAMNLSLEESLKFSMAMSIITISHKDSIHPEMSYGKVIEEIGKINWVETRFN